VWPRWRLLTDACLSRIDAQQDSKVGLWTEPGDESEKRVLGRRFIPESTREISKGIGQIAIADHNMTREAGEPNSDAEDKGAIEQNQGEPDGAMQPVVRIEAGFILAVPAETGRTLPGCLGRGMTQAVDESLGRLDQPRGEE